MKIRYIEMQPIKQIIEFPNREAYNIFISQRIKEIMDYTYPNNLNFREYFIYKSVHLKLDGTPRKEIDPTKWLMSEKSKKKQKKNFAIYIEKKKKEAIERGYKRRLAEFDFKIKYWTEQRQTFVDEHLKDF